MRFKITRDEQRCTKTSLTVKYLQRFNIKKYAEENTPTSPYLCETNKKEVLYLMATFINLQKWSFY